MVLWNTLGTILTPIQTVYTSSTQETSDDEDQPDKPRDDEPAVEPADETNAAPLDDNGGLKRSKRRKNVLKVNMIITEYVL
jgi:hypothetical protein